MQPAQNLVAETEEHDFHVNVTQLIRNQDPVPITLAQLHFAVLAAGSWITVRKTITATTGKLCIACSKARLNWCSLLLQFWSCLTHYRLKKLCGMLSRHAHGVGCHYSCVTVPVQSAKTALGLVGVLLVVVATGMVVLPQCLLSF